MNEEITYSGIRKLSISFRASVMKTRAKTLFLKFGTGDLKDILVRLSKADILDHPELDKINDYLFRLEGMAPPSKEQSCPEELAKLKRLAGDE